MEKLALDRVLALTVAELYGRSGVQCAGGGGLGSIQGSFWGERATLM